MAKPSQSQQHSNPNPNPQSAGGGDDSFGSSPPAAIFGAAVDLGQAFAGETRDTYIAPQPKPPKDTAALIAHALDVLCAATTWPLDENERKRFERDLLPVLVKHQVPDVGGNEELKLGLTTFGIVGPRWKDWADRKKALEQEAADHRGATDDRSSTREEGQRQERRDPQAGIPSTGGPNTAASVLA